MMERMGHRENKEYRDYKEGMVIPVYRENEDYKEKGD